MEEDEEEEDNDNYPTFTEDGDTTMGEDEMSPLLMSTMMILVGPFLMHR